jgi:hypothetical protein
MSKHLPKRLTSLRAMRRLLDRITVEAAEGRRPTSDVAKFAAALKASSEIFMAEGTLARAGLDAEVQEHQGGQDGGLGELNTRGYVEKVVSYKKGVSPKGTEVDESKVQITGSADDIDLDLIKDLL